MTHQHRLSLARPSGSCAWLHHIALAGALLAAGSAQAVVSAPGTTEFGGNMADITYGSTGNIFQLDPALFVLGLGDSGNPQSVAGRAPLLLQYSFSVSGQDSGLMTIEYRMRNISQGETINQLRFMVFANPDGGDDFNDVLSETWGPAGLGNPVLREGREFVNPITGIKAGFGLNNNLSEGAAALDPACTALPGCDATVGLQWNAPVLAPGETFRVRLGLSDTNLALSSRFLTIRSATAPDTVLTFSGQSAILPVPEPAAVWTMAAGLAALGLLARRRRAA
jgi:hypothetical protein